MPGRIGRGGNCDALLTVGVAGRGTRPASLNYDAWPYANQGEGESAGVDVTVISRPFVHAERGKGDTG